MASRLAFRLNNNTTLSTDLIVFKNDLVQSEVALKNAIFELLNTTIKLSPLLSATSIVAVEALYYDRDYIHKFRTSKIDIDLVLLNTRIPWAAKPITQEKVTADAHIQSSSNPTANP